jgi:hypothetical protein
MNRGKRYKRKCGDMEIRILPDGRVVLVAPDEKMLEVAKNVTQQETDDSDEVKDNGEGE